MYQLIATAEVEDPDKWDAGFKTHKALFQKQTVISPIKYSVRKKDRQIAILFEVENLDTCFRVIDSPETAEAMAFDGIKRETVKFFVLDEEFSF